MFGFINLDEFHHTYKVVGKNGKTEFAQTVLFEPKSFRVILKKVIINGFRKRLPESFDEFKKHAETK